MCVCLCVFRCRFYSIWWCVCFVVFVFYRRHLRRRCRLFFPLHPPLGEIVPKRSLVLTFSTIHFITIQVYRATACRIFRQTNGDPENLVVLVNDIQQNYIHQSLCSSNFYFVFVFSSRIFFLFLLCHILSFNLCEKHFLIFSPDILLCCCCCLTLKSKMFCIPFQNAGTEEISYNITWWISRLCRNCCRQGINVYTWNVFHFRCCVVVVVYRLLTILLFSHLVYFDVVFVVVLYLHLVWCLFFLLHINFT